ncbi:hypothetical protein AAFC00_005879 [Neodothiora populina]|uniref:ABM domain-containing protein n=1 Tax=Neodothiora populina TaxID=2781224 RepID=A0ABR3P6A6_9PEZI
MPIAELATIPLKAGTNIVDQSSQTGGAFKSAVIDVVSKQEGFQTLFYGREVESPDVAQLIVNWESLEAHQKFMKVPAYQPMVEKLTALMDGGLSMTHFDFPSSAAQAIPLSAPVTEMATFYVNFEDKASYQSIIEKFSSSISEFKPVGFLGVASGWSLEDVEHEGLGAGKQGKAILLILGWQSVDAHKAYNETDHFKDAIKQLGTAKGFTLHHTSFKGM